MSKHILWSAHQGYMDIICGTYGTQYIIINTTFSDKVLALKKLTRRIIRGNYR